jgi:hypothetical protein
MALDPDSALGQAEKANDKLAEYFSNMGKFAADIGGATIPPDFQETLDEFDYSELHRMSTTRAGDSASFQNGAAIENAHAMAAINREFNLRRKGKIDYYSDAASDYTNESNFYSTMKSFWVNMLSGNYEEGKTS